MLSIYSIISIIIGQTTRHTPGEGRAREKKFVEVEGEVL